MVMSSRFFSPVSISESINSGFPIGYRAVVRYSANKFLNKLYPATP